MEDGSFLAFFEEPDEPFDFKEQRDFDLHIALEVEYDEMLEMKQRGEEEGIETRGVSDHDFIHSIYFRDPNGYVIELTARTKPDDEVLDTDDAHRIMERWQAAKT